MHTITNLLPLLRDKDNDAATAIYKRFIVRVIELVRTKMNFRTDAALSEEIAHEVLTELILRADRNHANSWPRLETRQDVLQIIVRKIGDNLADRARAVTAKKRGGGLTVTALDAYCESIAKAENSAIKEEYDRVLTLAPSEVHRTLIHLMLQGHTLTECAAALGINVRTVQRKLDDLRRCMTTE
jgi:DNA-directed RNA polymerase specialized sigma24 family protein